MPMDYAAAGVDIAAGAAAVELMRAAVQSTYTPAVIGDIGGFGGLYSATALQAMDDPILVATTDGVGTKLALAQRLGRSDGVGIDLVAMCVNDLVATGARPLFFLDYLALGQLQAEFVATLVAGIAAGCRQAGCALIGGETAEHPGVMAPGDYDLAGFAVGVVERSRLLGPQLVRPGDQIIGLASSGLHSNGYSLVRRAWTDQLSPAELNTQRLADGRSLAEALMAPTTIYVQTMLAALAELPAGSIHAVAHITGGGISENLNRVLPPGLDAILNAASWPVPEVIQRAVSAAGLDLAAARRTFNMGLGLVVIVDASCRDSALARLQTAQPAWWIGQVQNADTPERPGLVRYQEVAE